MGRPKMDQLAKVPSDGKRIRQLWDRQDHEGAEAYRAFCRYRELGSGERSYEVVSQEIGCSIQLLKRWGSRHRWVNRALAWDDYIDSLQQERSIRARLAMHQRHARAAMALVEKGAQGVERLRASKLAPRDRVAMIRAGTEIERLARGEESNGPDLSASINTRVSISFGSHAPPAWAIGGNVELPPADKDSESDQTVQPIVES